MQLNVLPDDEVQRTYRRALGLWSSHLSDEMAFGSAAVYANANLARIPEANCVLGEVADDQSIPIADYFKSANTAPLAWYLPAGAPAKTWPPMRDRHLVLLRLAALPTQLPQTHPELTIIPARASFRHVRQIAAAIRPEIPPDQAGDAACFHLDDSHVDALLALHDGQAAGFACVLSTGQAGMITDLFVLPPLRHRGYAQALAGQLLQICVRAMFQHVVCAVDAQDAQAIRFAARIGFVEKGRAAWRSGCV